MDARLQRRIQRYGWDRAAPVYESLWGSQLAPAQAAVLAYADLVPGERVVDVASGTGATAIEAAGRVAPGGHVVGVDLSAGMVAAARALACQRNCANATFERMDAEGLDLPERSFDVAMCVLGLMYLSQPEKAVRHMQRLLRPHGRMVLAVWGERTQCGWAQLFPIIDAEVTSDVCPLFFRLGQADALAALCRAAGLGGIQQTRIKSILTYQSDDEACNAAFVGGPVALAWSRLDVVARARVRSRYLESIEQWRKGTGFEVPGEFVIVAAAAGCR